MSESEDEEIGYKKPPKASQWKPGESGNKKGRPKKTKDFEKLFDQELSQPIRITEGGETRMISRREALLKKLIGNALNNDKTALKLVFGLMKSHHTIEEFAPDAGDREALMALFEKARLEDQKPEEPCNG